MEGEINTRKDSLSPVNNQVESHFSPEANNDELPLFKTKAISPTRIPASPCKDQKQKNLEKKVLRFYWLSSLMLKYF